MTYRAKLAKGGKISIPSAYRKQLNLKSGEEILFDFREGEIILFPIKSHLERVRRKIQKFCSDNEDLVDKLITERRNEAKNE